MAISAKLETIPQLLGDALEQLGGLAKAETELARAEISQSVTNLTAGVAFLAAAATIAIPTLVMLSIALSIWLSVSAGLSPVASYLVVAMIGAALSAVLAMVGLNFFRPDKLKPTATLHQVKRDIATAKDL